MRAETSPANSAAADSRWHFAVSSGILGWVLDAFDFFVIIFLFDVLSAHFGVGKRDIVFTITLTLAMRPVGALLFGTLADRFGRRVPLMVCVAYFSLVSLASAYAPSYTWFAVLRALYGIGMGGYWGIGASYAMESTPVRWRGLFSGILQSGYPFGYLLAALGMSTLAPLYGWRSLFFVSLGVAALVILLTAFSPESRAWKEHAAESVGTLFKTVGRNWKIFIYLLAVMMMMGGLSHGTQDLYPDFLRSIPGIAKTRVLGMNLVYGVPIIYNIGAILGALVFGELSERFGRRRAILFALAVCIVAIPWWAFGTTVAALLVGSFVMQSGVQGAFGVIPAHLNELSPDTARSLFPGFVYQLGVLLAAPAVAVEYLMRDHLGYPKALAVFELGVILTLGVLFTLGSERRGRNFHQLEGSTAS
jgi:SHS family lactate transporter-like MFS transporter